MRVAVSATQYRPEPITRAISTTLGVTYSGALALDVYRPTGLTGRPVLILAHGGGWQAGARSDAGNVGIAQQFASLGFVVFALSYTLVTPGNRTAGQRQPPITDMLACMSWARANAATYGGDVGRIAMLGTSAGGHLALMAACQGVAGTTRPDAVIGWSAPTRLESLTGQGLTPFAEDYMGDVTPTGIPWDTYSPYYAVAGAAGAMCPLRIVNSASEDVAQGGIAQAQADDMHTAALAASVSSTKRIIPGTVHADFRSMDVDGSAAWLASTLEWPRTTIRTSAGTRATAVGRVAA